MARLDRTDRLHLEAAQGWLGLGNWREANDELGQITPDLRAQADVLQAAHDLLSGVLEQFPKDQAIRYDLACYCCQLGKLKEAMDHLERAIDLAGDDIRHRALDDLALEPLWANIEEI